MAQWQFWIDRGGTFTDVIAISPTGELQSLKLLSENPRQYKDPAIHAIRQTLLVKPNAPIPTEKIESIKMGTTVATNALLERKGEKTLLAITAGFKDALRIAYQNRPDIFAQKIILPEQLYSDVVEIDERIDAQGNVLTTLNLKRAQLDLAKHFDQGYRAIAIVLMHAYQFKQHEHALKQLAIDIGFTQISVSHEISPLVKIVSRGDTTVVDAYLTPILKRYIDQITQELPGVKLYFMQSNGGLAKAEFFRGKNSILSGPAGGVVGASLVSRTAGFEKMIGFDMGGTSTDVCHFSGVLERQYDTEVAGVRLKAPMLAIHTIAAGGGSILKFKQGRLQVGPESAGSKPGPACYRNNGPLTITDCNVLLGKIMPKHFPNVFGHDGNQSLDKNSVIEKFSALTKTINQATLSRKTSEQIAEGFLDIAIENMANAIKKISIQKGHDISEYVLTSFGGAGGQHACKIAEKLGLRKILLHPLAGVLSAYGIGCADIRFIAEQSIEAVFNTDDNNRLEDTFDALKIQCQQQLEPQLIGQEIIQYHFHLRIRYQGSDTALSIPYQKNRDIESAFTHLHQERFGFTMPGNSLTIDSAVCEAQAKQPIVNTKLHSEPTSHPKKTLTTSIFSNGKQHETDIYFRDQLRENQSIKGPAIIVEAISTIIIEPTWQATLTKNNELILEQLTHSIEKYDTKLDPIRLEIFNNLYMNIAEQMGTVLANTAHSVNIKERLDFSCAIFDEHGNLIANAPHIPVHLGSMGASVKSLIKDKLKLIQDGDVYAINNPYNGGTHLPDITVITPVFKERQLLFFIASRGHHADIGGITPGSMPASSTNINEEGVMLDNELIVRNGEFFSKQISILFLKQTHPARNVEQNLKDLQAQIAANQTGVSELNKMIQHFSLHVVQAYMQYVQDNAELAVKEVLSTLKSGEFNCTMDNGCVVKLKIDVDQKNQQASIDFTGSSKQQTNNFNAPFAVCRAAILYVFRTLVTDNIPLNEGCLKPINIIMPEDCFLNPRPPAAVVAGNVETSQVIVNTLYGALNIMAAAQGTMNNFTFGNDQYQYYETIAGGSGAGRTFNGTDAVQTHMTNSRMTDSEVLELRFPVLIKDYSIRHDSGGQGKHHGGNGVTRIIQFNEAMHASILSGFRKIAPFGLSGGDPGKVGRNYVVKRNGEIIELQGCTEIDLEPGDQFVIETPGGGGFSS